MTMQGANLETARPGFLRRLDQRGRKPVRPETAPAPGALPITRFNVCNHPRCMRGSADLLVALTKESDRKDLGLDLGQTPTLCRGDCRNGPFVALPGPELFYRGVAARQAREMVRETGQHGRVLFDRLILEPYALTDHRVHFDRDEMVMVLMEPDMCLVDAAFYLFGFNARESCGKCVPCRVGVHLVAAWERDMTQGRIAEDAIQRLGRCIAAMAMDTYCEFGAKVTAPLRLLLEQGRAHLEAHMAGECPKPDGHVLSGKTLGIEAMGVS